MWHSVRWLLPSRRVAGLRGIALARPVTRANRTSIFFEPSLEKVLALLLQERDLSLVNVNFPDENQKVCLGRVPIGAAL